MAKVRFLTPSPEYRRTQTWVKVIRVPPVYTSPLLPSPLSSATLPRPRREEQGALTSLHTSLGTGLVPVASWSWKAEASGFLFVFLTRSTSTQCLR